MLARRSVPDKEIRCVFLDERDLLEENKGTVYQQTQSFNEPT